MVIALAAAVALALPMSGPSGTDANVAAGPGLGVMYDGAPDMGPGNGGDVPPCCDLDLDELDGWFEARFDAAFHERFDAAFEEALAEHLEIAFRERFEAAFEAEFWKIFDQAFADEFQEWFWDEFPGAFDHALEQAAGW
jgi:hypothetical protein